MSDRQDNIFDLLFQDFARKYLAWWYLSQWIKEYLKTQETGYE